MPSTGYLLYWKKYTKISSYEPVMHSVCLPLRQMCSMSRAELRCAQKRTGTIHSLDTSTSALWWFKMTIYSYRYDSLSVSPSYCVEAWICTSLMIWTDYIHLSSILNTSQLISPPLQLKKTKNKKHFLSHFKTIHPSIHYLYTLYVRRLILCRVADFKTIVYYTHVNK